MVGLDEHADRVAALRRRPYPRCRADPSLEAVADHPRATADGALGHPPRTGLRDRLVHVGRLDVKAVDVVEHPVPGLSHDREAPPVAGLRTPLLQLVRDQRIAHDADAVRVGQGDRGGQHPGLANPLQTGQLTVAVEAVGTSEQGLPPQRSRRQDHRHPGANRAPADLERALTLDQRRVTNPHTGHVGNRVVGTWRSLADDDPGFARSHPLAGSTHLSDSLIPRLR